MKILHINSYYSNSLFYKNLFENQIKKGLDIDVFVPVHKHFIKNDFEYGDYTTISRNHGKYDRFIFYLKHHKIYKDITKKFNIKEFSITHAHSLFSNGYISMRIKKDYGIPYIVAVRNTDVNLFFRKLIHLRKLGVEILKEASHIVFLSEPYKNSVIDAYVPRKHKSTILKKSIVIPNGIDEFWFRNIGSPKQQPKDRNLRLLQIGDINKNKNIETTIRAIDILKKRGYNIKLDVVGKIRDQYVFNKIKDLDYINYLGYKSKEELIKIYNRNDILVLPSIHETFGLVYAEAMSQGLPVIYTRGQGFDGHFEDGEVGYSVICIDAEQIADRILDINNNYNELSDRCIESVRTFDWDVISKKYTKLYIS